MKKVIILGGMTCNVPHQLLEHFEVVRQYQQDEVNIRGTVPQADLIFVIRNWVSHKQINTLKLQRPSVPMIWLNKGWNSMREELERRELIERVAVAVPEEPLEDDGLDSEGLPEAEVDPLEKMSDEELEKLTRPEPAPSRTFSPQEYEAMWKERLSTWAGPWAEKSGVSATRIMECFASRANEYTMDGVARKMPDLSPNLVRKMMVGFYRIKAAFVKNPWPKAVYQKGPRKNVKELEPALPPILSDDVSALLRNAQLLVDKRNALLGEIDSLRDRVAKIDKDLEAVKPLILAVENMKKVAAQIKTNAEKELTAQLIRK
jgi:hypothetical protein